MIDRSKAPATHPISQITLPPLDREVLANGIELFTIDSGDIDVNQLFMAWRGGEYEAPNRVVAAMCSAMLTEGAAGLSGAEIAERLDFRGAILRTEADSHHSLLSLTCVNSLSSGLAPTLGAIIERPDFPRESLAMHLEIRKKHHLQQLAKVSTLARNALAPLVMGADHPMAREIPLSDFDEVNRQSLIDFHNRVYVDAPCRAFLSGRLTEAVRSDVKGLLSQLPCRGERRPISYVPFRGQPPRTVRVEKADALQSAVAMGIPAVPRSHPDYLPLRFTVIALGGYFGSRLMRNIREEKGYTYGISAALYGMPEGSYVFISAQCANQYVDPVIAETKIELERLATEPMPDAELRRLRLHVQSSLIETVDSPFAIMGYYRTRELVGLPDNYFDEQLRLSREIDAPTIMSMARKYLDPSQLRIAIAGA